MNYVFKVLDEASATLRRHLLRPGEHVVGAAPECDVRLEAPGVSRRHARLEVLADGGLLVTDLGSRNGTFVNNRKIRRTAVTDYAVVVFGSTQTVIHTDEKGMAQIALASALASAAEAPPPQEADGEETSTQGLSLAEGLAADLTALIAGSPAPREAALALARSLRTRLPVASVELRRSAGGREVVAAASGKRTADAKDVRFEASEWVLALASDYPIVLRRLRPFLELSLTWLAGIEARGSGPQAPPADPTPPAAEGEPPPGVVSSEMRTLYRLSGKIAKGEIPLLILGESGTGKEVLARWIHGRSRRAGGPFLAVNCAALPHELLEAELFGIERGVATGVEARSGLLEQAGGGTLFLDEIGDMPLEIQAKVLRVLESTRVLRVGGRRPVAVDVRFVAATHQDLERAMEKKRFRRDLYHRLAAFIVRLPPLRERPEDIALLTGHFFDRELARRGTASPGITRRALAALIAWDWPGNVRQLHNEIARAVLLIEPGEALDVHHLSPPVAGSAEPDAERLPLGLADAVARAERQAIRTAQTLAGGDAARSIELLGVSRTTYYRKLKELSLEGEGEP